jgi:hypothetical protein
VGCVEVFVEYSLVDVLGPKISLVDVIDDLLGSVDDLCTSGIGYRDVQEVSRILACLVF